MHVFYDLKPSTAQNVPYCILETNVELNLVTFMGRYLAVFVIAGSMVRAVIVEAVRAFVCLFVWFLNVLVNY